MKWFFRLRLLMIGIAFSLLIAFIAWQVARPAGKHVSETILRSFDIFSDATHLGYQYPILTLEDVSGKPIALQLVYLKDVPFKGKRVDVSIGFDSYLLATVPFTPFELEKKLFLTLESLFKNSVSLNDTQLINGIEKSIQLKPYNIYIKSKENP